MSYSYRLPAGAKHPDRGLFLTFRPFKLIAGMKFSIDGKTYAFSEEKAPYGNKTIFRGKAQKLIFNSTDPVRAFSVTLPKKTWIDVNEKRLEANRHNQFKYFAFIRIRPDKEGNASLLLNMRCPTDAVSGVSDTFANINFWKDDRLHIPDFGKSRNLAQNPSFEAGLRYYTYSSTWSLWRKRNKPVYEIDDTIARSGNCSLKLNASSYKDDLRPGYLQTFTIPTVPGKKYTVSFYAKSNRKSGLYLQQYCVSGIWKQFPKVPSFSVTTDEWKRYTYTVTAPNNALVFLFMPMYRGKDDAGGVIWLDDLQIEAGDKATEYTEKPLVAELLTSDPDNFLHADTKDIATRLRIIAPPNSVGTVECELEDFFCAKPWKQSFKFKTDAKGIAEISLSLDNVLGTGVYVLRADFKLPGGYQDKDFFRISRMKFLSNTHKNKNIFGMGWRNSVQQEALARRYCDIGLGSTRGHTHNRDFTNLMSANGIDICLEYLVHGGKGISNKDFCKIKSVTPELESRMENIAYETAKAYPWVKRWALSSELARRSELVKSGNFKDFARLQLAFRRGVKRFSSKKAFILGGSCNMQPQNGIRFVDNYLKAVNEIDSKHKFDGVTIHPYRTRPENPSLDEDAEIFLRMLDRHGYHDIPTYWDEGIYYTFHNIPAWGLNPYKGCSADHWRARTLSYHMGWGERIASAYYARSWLVALKYQDRVKEFISNAGGIFLDAYLTPYAVQKVSNTLGNILGNASFKKDIRFAPDIRCYVFEDKSKNPVAAIWSYDQQIDRGYKKSPIARFRFNGKPVEIYDLMENKHSINIDEQGNSDIPITPFPIFIKGRAGEFVSFCSSLQNAWIIASAKASVQISAKPLNSSELEVRLHNLVTRPFVGKVEMKLSNKLFKTDIHLKEKGSKKIIIASPGKIPDYRIAKISLPVNIEEKGQKPIRKNLSFRAFAVKKIKKGQILINGNEKEWGKIPVIKIKNRKINRYKGGTTITPINEKVGYKGDFEAEYQMAWDNKNLYLRVQVIDDVFFHDLNKKSVGYRYDNDGKCVKSGLTTTPPGTGGYMTPQLYPVMLLTE